MENLEENFYTDNTSDEIIEPKENNKIDITSLSKAERRGLARSGTIPVVKQNIYTRFEDETPQFGK